jgi:hypothetical protein
MASFNVSGPLSGVDNGAMAESMDGAGDVEREAAAVAFELGDVGRLGRSIASWLFEEVPSESTTGPCVGMDDSGGTRDPWPSSALVLSASSISGGIVNPPGVSLQCLCQRSGISVRF